jgi:multidrug resistance protein MdtO
MAQSIQTETDLALDQKTPSLRGFNGDKATVLLAQIIEVTEALRALLLSKTALSSTVVAKEREAKPKGPLIVPDAFTNPDYFRYALKTTLAIFVAYIAYTMLYWPGIRTCMITCFFVALGSLGETSHKMVLRLTGAALGGALGLGSVLFIMPYLTTITDLCLLVGVAAFIASWVALSSERLSYAGLQIAMAFFFSTLVGFGPSIDLTEARDRVVGILLGNIIMFVVFSTIWPVSAQAQAQKFLAAALEKLSRLLGADGEREDLDALSLGLEDDLAQARRFLSLDPFEPEPVKRRAKREVDTDLINVVQALCAPAVIVSSVPNGENTLAARDYKRSVSVWLSRVSETIQSGKRSAAPPELGPLARAADADWYRELDRRVHRLNDLLNREAGVAT